MNPENPLPDEIREEPRAPGSLRPVVLSLTIKERSTLYAAYTSSLRNGGIFIPTTRPYKLGEEVFMILNLMNDPNKISVAGKVAWITPENAQTRKVPGIGVHFDQGEAGRAARTRIESILGGLVNASRSTHTL
jgi:type IV pilus assembly protein PilZ